MKQKGRAAWLQFSMGLGMNASSPFRGWTLSRGTPHQTGGAALSRVVLREMPYPKIAYGKRAGGLDCSDFLQLDHAGIGSQGPDPILGSRRSVVSLQTMGRKAPPSPRSGFTGEAPGTAIGVSLRSQEARNAPPRRAYTPVKSVASFRARDLL